MKFLTAFAALCPLLAQVRAKTDDEPRKLQGGDLTINGVIDGTILSQAIEIANVTSLLDSEGPFTLFAPEDAAFGPIDPKFLEPMYNLHLTDVLAMHVLSGTFLSGALTPGTMLPTLNEENSITVSEGPMLGPSIMGTASVVEPDIPASNGVVHTISDVLIPSWVPLSLFDLAKTNDDLSTLVSAIEAAGLNETLSDPDANFTVFAPTNDAFMKIENLDNITSDVELLTTILKTHVVDTIITADMATNDTIITTLSGEELMVTVMPGMTDEDMPTIMLMTSSGSMATIVGLDVLANNGIGHAIDTVLIPSMETPSPTFAPTESPTMAPVSGASSICLVAGAIMSTMFALVL